MHRTLFGLALAACLVGCGGGDEVTYARADGTAGGEARSNQNAPPPEPVGAGVAVAAPVPTGAPGVAYPGRRGSGTSLEDPVLACGPMDSYVFVASEVQCPGGGNPLGGDPEAGQQARVGNVGANGSGHIIDLYRVPCPSGPLEVYVDLYGCPEWEARLRAFEGR
ncbi:MAG: hypothetical protein RID81_01400 [Sandaracinaceae bacterium]|nr:MAG: hypothetical protein EVA89_28165 [Sandaracinaceae bacterium]